MISILLVDDKADFLKLAKNLMEMNGGVRVTTAGSAEEALKLVKKKRFDVIISDYLMDGLDGIEMLRDLRGSGDDTPVIIYASVYKDNAALNAVRSGAEFFFQKSTDLRSQLTELRYIVEEIVKRKAAEDALWHQERDFKAIVESNADAMIVLDRSGVIRYTNPAATTLFNLSGPELIGKMLGFPVILKEPVEMYILRGYREFVAAEMRMVEVEWEGEPSYLISFRDVTGHVRYEEELNEMRDHLEVEVDKRTRELRTINETLKGEIQSRAAVEAELRDEIEERHALEEELRKEIELRERTEKNLTEAKASADLYLDLMGHDINNLNQIGIGYLEMAREAATLEEAKALMEKPLEVMTSASHIIDNVRKLKQLSVDKPEERAVKVIDMCGRLRYLVDRYRYIDNREIHIHLRAPELCFILADDLVDDVFSNLIDNCIKHSDPLRPLMISLKVFPVQQKGTHYYRCEVEDNGPGVPDWIKDKIFRRFQRGSTKAHGKGLGLYLIKTLVEGYKGAVWVEDRIPGVYNQGARFVVMLPAKM